MARNQARRRRPTKLWRVARPTIAWRHLIAPIVVVATVFGTYHLSRNVLDRPIRRIEINGPMQRVTALNIEEAIGDELDRGFISADLSVMHDRIAALPWIDEAVVARRWPSQICITVTEQVPAAVWDDRGLLNIRGELFVTQVRHIPPELPRLSGPEHRVADVAQRYLAARKRLIPIGLDLRSVRVDTRGAWQMTLANGVEVRIGRRAINERTELFLDVVADIVSGRAADIQYVDMRYGNGFAIGWNDGASKPDVEAAQDDKELLASKGGN